MIHLIPSGELHDGPVVPASLATEGFVHCSGEEPTALAVAEAFLADAPRPLLALVVDESRLDVPVEHVEGRVPGGTTRTTFPHVLGPIPRSAVVDVLEVRRDAGHPVALVPRGNSATDPARSHG